MGNQVTALLGKKIEKSIGLRRLDDGRLEIEPVNSIKSAIGGLAMAPGVLVILCAVLVISTGGRQGVTWLIASVLASLFMGAIWWTCREHILFDTDAGVITRRRRLLGISWATTVLERRRLEAVAVDGDVVSGRKLGVKVNGWWPSLILVSKTRDKIPLDGGTVDDLNAVGQKLADYLDVEFYPGEQWMEVRLVLGPERVEVEHECVEPTRRISLL